MTSSEFVAHEPCENCGSSDANSVYSDGHKFCFVCQTYTPAEGIIHSQTMSKDVHLKGSAERLHKRNLSEKTCQFYKIFRDEDTLRFPYFTSDGVLKIRRKFSPMKEFPLTPYLVSIYFLILVNVLLLLKVS